MAHIVIIGASTGGLPTAYELKKKLGERHQVSVVSNSPIFQFVPSNPWVAVGWRKREQTTFDLFTALNAKEIDFYDVGARRIDPDKQSVELEDETLLDYDYLVVATGPKLAFDEIEGLGPEGKTSSICTVDHAEQTYLRWQDFIKSPGPIVVGATQGASCFGPAYEFAFILNHALRKIKIRDQVPITFITPEPYIGHMGLGGVSDSKGFFESEFRKVDIKWLTNTRVRSIAESHILAEQVNEKAETEKTFQLPFKFSMLIPPFKGVDCIAELGDELVNPRGFLKVDAYQRNPKYPNIYGVGVCIAIPPVETTPLAVGAPKTGYMIESMTKAVVENIKADIEKQGESVKATWNALCLADMGHTGALFVASPQIPPRNTAWIKKGWWAWLMKRGFEKYFLFNMKRGVGEPWYECLILKLFGIRKIK